MATIQIEAQVPTDRLLKAVGQLSQSDLEQFVFQVITLRAQRQAPHLPQAEADLLLTINQGLPTELEARYNELIAKRQAETLTQNEHNELTRLTDQVEELETRRIQCLAELARLHQTTLAALMQTLGIREPTYA